jgi:hypothetical protein
MWRALQKTQKRIVTLRHSPCNDTLTPATAPATTVEIVCSFLFPYSPFRYTAVAILHLSLQVWYGGGRGITGTWAVPRGNHALLSFSLG